MVLECGYSCVYCRCRCFLLLFLVVAPLAVFAACADRATGTTYWTYVTPNLVRNPGSKRAREGTAKTRRSLVRIERRKSLVSCDTRRSKTANVMTLSVLLTIHFCHRSSGIVSETAEWSCNIRGERIVWSNRRGSASAHAILLVASVSSFFLCCFCFKFLFWYCSWSRSFVPPRRRSIAKIHTKNTSWHSPVTNKIQGWVSRNCRKPNKSPPNPRTEGRTDKTFPKISTTA
mmetsp:Transcript_6460/g.13880  ORF Transcript_6460/g.13880 Transcript_6460/m.13880 type:complete len:231 (+) Transcript_6460:740-1432(+)